MKKSPKNLAYSLIFISLNLLNFVSQPVMAQSDKSAMAAVQKARELKRTGNLNHSKHLKHIDKSNEFRGVYYGYLPCDYCAGIKMTLSLKNKKNYLLVTQYAQASTKEFYEKGKYDWNETTRILTLTPRKSYKKAVISKFRIKNETALLKLTAEGGKIRGNQDAYTLMRADKNQAREVHIH